MVTLLNIHTCDKGSVTKTGFAKCICFVDMGSIPVINERNSIKILLWHDCWDRHSFGSLAFWGKWPSLFSGLMGLAGAGEGIGPYRVTLRHRSCGECVCGPSVPLQRPDDGSAPLVLVELCGFLIWARNLPAFQLDGLGNSICPCLVWIDLPSLKAQMCLGRAHAAPRSALQVDRVVKDARGSEPGNRPPPHSWESREPRHTLSTPSVPSVDQVAVANWKDTGVASWDREEPKPQTGPPEPKMRCGHCWPLLEAPTGAVPSHLAAWGPPAPEAHSLSTCSFKAPCLCPLPLLVWLTSALPLRGPPPWGGSPTIIQDKLPILRYLIQSQIQRDFCQIKNRIHRLQKLGHGWVWEMLFCLRPLWAVSKMSETDEKEQCVLREAETGSGKG